MEALKKAETDVEKISSLMLIAKHLNPSSLSKAQSLQLFSRLGLTFLYRLLITEDETFRSEEDTTPLLLQSIAVNIISSIILLVPTFLNTSMSVKLFTCFAKIVSSSKKRVNQEIYLLDDILYCYQCLIEINDPQENVIQIMKKSKSLDVLVSLFTRGDYGFEKVYPILSSLATKHSWILYDKPTYLNFIENLAKDFYCDNGRRKFYICSQLVSYFEHNSNGLTLEDEQTRNIVCHLSKGLKDIFTSRLNNHLRQLAFQLACALCVTFKGFDWMMEDTSYPLNFSSSFFCILSRLVCIEISLCLALEESDFDLIGSCFTILEYIIHTLTTDDEKEKIGNVINPSVFITILDALKETILHLISQLQMLSIQWKELRENEGNIFLVSVIVRILCVWILEGFELVKDELEEVIPFIVHLLKSESQLQLGHFIIPALHRICDNDAQLRQQIAKVDLKDVLNYYATTDPFKDEIDLICKDLQNLLTN